MRSDGSEETWKRREREIRESESFITSWLRLTASTIHDVSSVLVLLSKCSSPNIWFHSVSLRIWIDVTSDSSDVEISWFRRCKLSFS